MRIMAKLLGGLLVLTSLPALSTENGSNADFSKDEATEIAIHFFANEIGIEGTVTEPHRDGDHWVFQLKIGYAGNLAPDPILVNRFSGEASWAGMEEWNRTGSGPAK